MKRDAASVLKPVLKWAPPSVRGSVRVRAASLERRWALMTVYARAWMMSVVVMASMTAWMTAWMTTAAK